MSLFPAQYMPSGRCPETNWRSRQPACPLWSFAAGRCRRARRTFIWGGAGLDCVRCFEGSRWARPVQRRRWVGARSRLGGGTSASHRCPAAPRGHGHRRRGHLVDRHRQEGHRDGRGRHRGPRLAFVQRLLRQLLRQPAHRADHFDRSHPRPRRPNEGISRLRRRTNDE